MQKCSVSQELNRLKAYTGLSLTKIAKRMGYSGASSIQRYFSPEYTKDRLPLDTAELFADAFAGLGDPPVRREDVLALAGINGAHGLLHSRSGLVYAGIAEADVFRNAALIARDHEGIVDFDRDGHFPNVAQYAWKIHGDSMDLANFPPGFYVRGICYDDYVPLYGEPLDGEFVVVRRSRHSGTEVEHSVKEVHYFRDRIELWPRSSNPVHKELVIPYDPAPTGDEDIKIVAIVTAVFLTFERPSAPRRRLSR